MATLGRCDANADQDAVFFPVNQYFDVFPSPNRSPVVVNGNAPPSLRVSTIPGFGDEHGIKLDWMKQLDTKAVSEVRAAPKHLPARRCSV